MLGNTKFWFIGLSLVSALMVVFRVMTSYHIGIGTVFYSYLTALAILLPFVFALLFVGIATSRVRNLYLLAFIFIVFLTVGFLISGVLTGGSTSTNNIPYGGI